MKSLFRLIIIVISFISCLSCQERNEVKTPADTAIDTAAPEPLTEDIILEEIAWHLQRGNYNEAIQWRSMLSEERQAEIDIPTPAEEPLAPQKVQPEKPKTTKQATDNKAIGNKTIYISTYGANGKVWGHVKMNGNTGRGTIHDEDENSYTITVTRHGNELYGVDQNSRQYIFKL